jgi:hypothetical protein
VLSRGGGHGGVGEEGHVTGAEDALGHKPLVLGAVTVDASGIDLASFRYELPESGYILVVYRVDVLGAEAAHPAAVEGLFLAPGTTKVLVVGVGEIGLVWCIWHIVLSLITLDEEFGTRGWPL